MRLALFQPDIPPNTGTMLRMSACFGIPVDVIEPCGFPFSEAALRRAGMDYLDKVQLTRHLDWQNFLATIGHGRADGPRLVLLTTKSAVPHTDLIYRKDDILLVGQESAGAPPEVHAAAGARVRIPMQAGTRSLNVAISAAIVLAEALRQTGGWPQDDQIEQGTTP
ncbi:tRNA (cytidine(34)-2'-O)-methyltransferase [Govanella unica]|uniref:tRNA (cytidine(34)-2'-O)-methyltransferase n=1 Tax=Govanella unica TaxID=2975056 RepID=A0A9X3TWT9_9PROT|nr:tRNA (cytidine(34)-2'-O)-methyltransferase [Govania unica]MDA5193401.1 tRNA (cytidine(34)-2'-O)-methyltransferase [Govania unica]